MIFDGFSCVLIDNAQVKSDSFPVHWNGAGRALDLSKTPGRIGLQLSMNSKNSLVHYQAGCL